MVSLPPLVTSSAHEAGLSEVPVQTYWVAVKELNKEPWEAFGSRNLTSLH